MRESSSASGPSKAATRTCVAVSGRRPSANRTAVSAGASGCAAPAAIPAITGMPGPSPATSVRLVRELQAAAGDGVDRRVLMTNQLHGARTASGGSRQRRGVNGMGPQPGDRRAVGGEHGEPPDPRAVRLAEGVLDPWQDTGVALRRVVQEPGQEQVVVDGAVGPKGRDDIETVALVGDVHRVIEGELVRGQPGGQGRALRRFDPCAKVAPKLTGLARPPGDAASAPHRPTRRLKIGWPMVSNSTPKMVWPPGRIGRNAATSSRIGPYWVRTGR